MTPRTEPMPEEIPDWLIAAASEESAKDEYKISTIARLLWERGEPEPVDPDVEVVRRIIAAYYNEALPRRDYYNAAISRAVAAYKAEKDRT